MTRQDPGPTDPTEGADLDHGGRRDLLKKLAVGGAIVWAAPAIARTASAQDAASNPPPAQQLVRQRWTRTGSSPQTWAFNPAVWQDPPAAGQWSEATTVSSGLTVTWSSGNLILTLTAGGTFSGSPNVWYRLGNGNLLNATAPAGATSFSIQGANSGQTAKTEAWVTWSRPA